MLHLFPVTTNGNGVNGQVNVLLILMHNMSIFSTYFIKSFNFNLILQNNEKSLQRWLEHELDVMVNVHEVRYEYEKQSEVYVAFRFYSISWNLCLSLWSSNKC